MSKLEELINEQYNGNLSQAEIQEASRNLLGFFKELQKINIRLEQEKLIENESNNKVRLYDKNNRSSN